MGQYRCPGLVREPTLQSRSDGTIRSDRAKVGRRQAFHGRTIESGQFLKDDVQ
jgi:hypothetical protein